MQVFDVLPQVAAMKNLRDRGWLTALKAMPESVVRRIMESSPMAPKKAVFLATPTKETVAADGTIHIIAIAVHGYEADMMEVAEAFANEGLPYAVHGDILKVQVPTKYKLRRQQKPRSYVRKDLYPVNDILSLVGHEQTVDLDGDVIDMTDGRYLNFALHGIECCECGIQGDYFAKERDFAQDQRNDPFHLNLYGKDEDGLEVMLCRDHYIPLSKGGTDDPDNWQTLCERCNLKKRDRLPTRPRNQKKQ